MAALVGACISGHGGWGSGGGTGSFPQAPCTSTGLVSLLFPLPRQVPCLQLAGGAWTFFSFFLSYQPCWAPSCVAPLCQSCEEGLSGFLNDCSTALCFTHCKSSCSRRKGSREGVLSRCVLRNNRMICSSYLNNWCTHLEKPNL